MAKGTIALTSEQGTWQGSLHWVSALASGGSYFYVEASLYVKSTETITVPDFTPFTGRIVLGSNQREISFTKISQRESFVGAYSFTVPIEKGKDTKLTIRANVTAPGSSPLGVSTIEGGEIVTLNGGESPGASLVYVNEAGGTMGKDLLLVFRRDHPLCTHEVRYSFGSFQGEITLKAGKSFLWTVPDLAYGCGLSGTCQIQCKTMLDRQVLGTTTCSVELRVPGPARPDLKTAVLGQATEIPCSRKSTNFLLKLILLAGGREYPVGEGKSDSIPWTPAYSLAELTPADREISGTLRCDTYNNGQLVGSETCPVVLTIPDNQFTKPWIRSLTLSPWSETLPQDYGYLRGKTGLKAEITAKPAYSPIASYEIIAGTQKAEGNPAIIKVLSSSGQVRVTAAVRDQRGFEARLTRTISVAAYENPRILPYGGEKQVICHRSDSSGALSQNGTCLKIKARAEATQLEGKAENLCSLSYRIRKGSEPFGEFLPLPQPVDQVLLSGSLSLKHSYQVELRAVDSLHTATVLTFHLLSGAVSFGLYDGQDGAAFGKYPELPHVVDLGAQMTLLVRGKLDLRGETWENLYLAPGVNPPLENLGSPGGCQYRVSGENHVYLAFTCSWPGDQTINRDPLPENLRPSGPVSGLCSCSEGIGMVTLGTDGFLNLSKTWNFPDPGWVQGRLDYFL